jgi:hypothetical protein
LSADFEALSVSFEFASTAFDFWSFEALATDLVAAAGTLLVPPPVTSA